MSKLVNLERKLYLHYRPGVVSDLDRHLGPCAIRGAPDGIPCHIRREYELLPLGRLL